MTYRPPDANDPFPQDPFGSQPEPGRFGDPFGDADLDPFADGAIEETLHSRPSTDRPAELAGALWAGGSSAPGGVEVLLRQAIDAVASARRAPLSASVLVARDELLEILQLALESLPDELRQARWLLRERDEFLAQRQREADSLLEEVRAQAQRMVQRTEIVRQANQVAQRLVSDARGDARRLRHEAEDFCDRKLAAFEVVLDRTARTVRAGRQRLATPPTGEGESAPGRSFERSELSADAAGTDVDDPYERQPYGASEGEADGERGLAEYGPPVTRASDHAEATTRGGWRAQGDHAVDPLFDQDQG